MYELFNGKEMTLDTDNVSQCDEATRKLYFIRSTGTPELFIIIVLSLSPSLLTTAKTTVENDP
jgi:hypothetical protein